MTCKEVTSKMQKGSYTSVKIKPRVTKDENCCRGLDNKEEKKKRTKF